MNLNLQALTAIMVTVAAIDQPDFKRLLIQNCNSTPSGPQLPCGSGAWLWLSQNVMQSRALFGRDTDPKRYRSHFVEMTFNHKGDCGFSEVRDF